LFLEVQTSQLFSGGLLKTLRIIGSNDASRFIIWKSYRNHPQWSQNRGYIAVMFYLENERFTKREDETISGVDDYG